MWLGATLADAVPIADGAIYLIADIAHANWRSEFPH
jgi:hypothetical protein